MGNQEYGISIVDDCMDDLRKVTLIEEAMELLNDGFPLDDELQDKLKEVGIDPRRFVELHEDKID